MIAIASDHRGVELKTQVADLLKKEGIVFNDIGTHGPESVDYPDYAIRAAEMVASGDAERAIVICHSGIGVCVSANKVRGIRAALCQTVEQAELSRRHTDANVLALPAGFVSAGLAREIVSKWLHTDFEGGRHGKRLQKIKEKEENQK